MYPNSGSATISRPSPSKPQTHCQENRKPSMQTPFRLLSSLSNSDPLVRLTQALRLALIGWVAVALGVPAEALAQTPAHAMIVLDGSNSMNARLSGDPSNKYVVVRDQLLAVLPTIRPGSAIGLTTFGAQRRSDCTDAAVVAPISSNREPLLDALRRYRPRGFSPVVLAMRTAAAPLPVSRAGDGKTSMVIIMDDLASCRGEDPCQVATALKRRNPGLAIHVVGVGMKQHDAAVMSCVAAQTGGKFFAAPDARSAAPSIKQVMALIGTDPRPSVALRPRSTRRPIHPRAAAKPAQVRLDDHLPGLHLAARLNSGGALIDAPIRWRVMKTGASAPTLAVAQATAPTISRELPNGRYQVVAEAGLVEAKRTVEVTSRTAQPVVLSLDAAMLAISAPLAKGGPILNDATLTVETVDSASNQAPGKPVWLRRAGTYNLVVPAGSYRVHAQAGLARATKTVTVTAGQLRHVALALDAGSLRIDVQRSVKGLQPRATRIVIERDDATSPTGRREVLRRVGDTLDLVLPKGYYLVSVQQGTASVGQRIAVTAGTASSRTITLNAVSARLVTRIGKGVPEGLPISYRVERIGGAKQVITRNGEAEPIVDLTPGRYRFEARVGAQNAVARYDADIKGGSNLRVTLKTGAGAVRLKIAEQMGTTVRGEVLWQVFDSRGRSVWHTGQSQPLLALVAGTYTVKAAIRDKQLQQTFDVKAGQSSVVEVGG